MGFSLILPGVKMNARVRAKPSLNNDGATNRGGDTHVRENHTVNSGDIISKDARNITFGSVEATMMMRGIVVGTPPRLGEPSTTTLYLC